MIRALNAQLLKSFPILEKCLPEIVESHIFLFLSWELERLGNAFQGKFSSCHSKFQWNLGE
jgi:hypothetical protein